MQTDIAILELRPGAGGEEAKIWAQDLLRMYTRFANLQGWKVEQLNKNTLRIRGPQAFTKLQNESGTHRVQRIPTTERSGRIHTSTATVAVLPDLPDTQITIRPQDLELEFFRSGSKGGQNVNKVSSAVRIRHKPSRIVVSAQTERDQYQNRQVAMSLLKARLWEREEMRIAQTLGQARSAIGRGMRAEKIRTYNYPQDRVTDHRLGKSFGNLQKIMDGKLDKIIELLGAVAD